jgi:hypothetical protein
MTTQPNDTLRLDFDTWKKQFEESKKECGVAEINTPGASKDSRESLHNTVNATDSMKDWRSFWKDVLDETEENFKTEEKLSVHKRRATDDFLDTICCALEEMDGDEVFDCFLDAVQVQYAHTKKEHEKSTKLIDLLIGLK